MKIGFIGLGKLGMQCAEVFASKYETFGYDIIEKKSDSLKIVNTIEKIAKNADIVFIAVQTPHDIEYGGEQPASHLPKKDFDYSILENTFLQIKEHIQSHHIVVLISTVLPGNVRSRLKQYLPYNELIYNPYLIAMGTVKEDFCNPEMVIIGTEEGKKDSFAVSTLSNIYATLINENTRYEIGTWEEAESIKIFYNTFISAKIAIVNMIQDVSERVGNINVDIVTKALANSTKRITSGMYMKAGMGDGGPCHPRDNIALSSLAERLDLQYDLFNAINYSREKQAQHVAEKLAAIGNPVVILGTNYKPNTSLKDGSYALLIAFYLAQMNLEFYLDNHPDKEKSYTYLLCHEHIYNQYPFYTNSIIFDIWRSFYTNRKDLSVYTYGNTRKNKD